MDTLLINDKWPFRFKSQSMLTRVAAWIQEAEMCQLLQMEIDLKRILAQITALVNDAAGTITPRACLLPLGSSQTTIEIILGTSTNAVYLEKLANITKTLPGYHDCPTSSMLVSTESKSSLFCLRRLMMRSLISPVRILGTRYLRSACLGSFSENFLDWHWCLYLISPRRASSPASRRKRMPV